MLDALIGNLEDVRAGSQDMRSIIYAVPWDINGTSFFKKAGLLRCLFNIQI